MASPIEALLEKSRRELLDLSTRNRLLSIPVSSKSARLIQVHDELSEQIYRLLVLERKAVGFIPGRASTVAQEAASPQEAPANEEEEGDLSPPEQERVRGGAKRHIGGHG